MEEFDEGFVQAQESKLRDRLVGLEHETPPGGALRFFADEEIRVGNFLETMREHARKEAFIEGMKKGINIMQILEEDEQGSHIEPKVDFGKEAQEFMENHICLKCKFYDKEKPDCVLEKAKKQFDRPKSEYFPQWIHFFHTGCKFWEAQNGTD